MSESEHPSPKSAPKATLILLVVGLGTMLTAMASSMMNLALPNIGTEFHLSIEDSGWVLQSFLLAVGTLLILVGRASDILGHRRIYLVGFVIFGGMSLLCGLSLSFGGLVVGRLLQGVGSAMVMASGPALLTTYFPPKNRGKALGMLATATYLGLFAGPPVGGGLVAGFGWRSSFFFNVPIALVLVAMSLFLLPRDNKKSQSKIHWAQALALVFGLFFSLLAFSETAHWTLLSWKTWGTIGLGIAGLMIFVILQRSAKEKGSVLLDLSLFRSRLFLGATISAVANYIALFVVTVLIPFYLEEGLGKDPATTGLILSIQPLAMAVITFASGWLSDIIGSRLLATAGMVILSMGVVGLSFMGEAGNLSIVSLWLGVVGLGTGIFISPNSSALMGAAPKNQQGAAGSILAEARIVGMLLGVATAKAVFQLAGGHTGEPWKSVDFTAMKLSLWVGAAIALFGALAASLRGSSPR